MNKKYSGISIGMGKDFAKRVEFFIGKKINKKYWSDIGRAFHLNTDVGGVYDSLRLMGLEIDDVIYEQDREVLRQYVEQLSKEKEDEN